MARLSAAFDPDGTVNTIQPVLIIPDDMTYEEYVRKNHEPPTFARFNGYPVNDLPYGMMEAFEESIKGIRFTPAVRDGKAHFVWLEIVIEFNLIRSRDCLGCSSIAIMIRDYDEIKWKKETIVPNAEERSRARKIRGRSTAR